MCSLQPNHYIDSIPRFLDLWEVFQNQDENDNDRLAYIWLPGNKHFYYKLLSAFLKVEYSLEPLLSKFVTEGAEK